MLFTSGFPGTSGRQETLLEPGDVLLSKPHHKHDLAKAIDGASVTASGDRLKVGVALNDELLFALLRRNTFAVKN